MPVSDPKNISEEAIGKLPQSMIEEELSELILWHENNTDIVCLNQAETKKFIYIFI